MMYEQPECEGTDWGPVRSTKIRPSRLSALLPSHNFGTGLCVCFPHMHVSQARRVGDRLACIPVATLPRAMSSTVWKFTCSRRQCQVSRLGAATRVGRAMLEVEAGVGRGEDGWTDPGRTYRWIKLCIHSASFWSDARSNIVH